VNSVANIGEQLPNADAKVFEVQIHVDQSDQTLRPSMTTGNKIVTKTLNDVVFIPLECVQTGSDSIPFVYLKNGTKQIVVLGESNENNVVVEKGLEPGTTLYLNTPANADKYTKMLGQDLISVIKEREKAKKEAERKASEQQQNQGGFGDRGMMGFPGGGNFGGGNLGGGNISGGNAQGGNNAQAGGNTQNAARAAAGVNIQGGQGGNFGGGRNMDTAQMRQMRQRFQNMPQAERDSMRARFQRQRGTMGQGEQGGQGQNGGQRRQRQQDGAQATQQTEQTTNNNR